MNDTKTHEKDLAHPLLVRQLSSMPLAAVLSTALVLVWVAYLLIAPAPPSPAIKASGVVEEKSEIDDITLQNDREQWVQVEFVTRSCF